MEEIKANRDGLVCFFVHPRIDVIPVSSYFPTGKYLIKSIIIATEMMREKMAIPQLPNIQPR